MKCKHCNGTGKIKMPTFDDAMPILEEDCGKCHGTGEFDPNEVDRFNAVDVIKVMEMVKKPLTNFKRITASPEALAEFLSDTCCRLLRDVWSNDGETGEGYWQEDESEWLNWLKQESE